MISFRAYNDSDYSRAKWFDLSLPQLLATKNVFAFGDGGIAIRGRDLGHMATIYHCKHDFEPNQFLVASLRDSSPQDRIPVAFNPHPWVADDVNALIPTLYVRVGGIDHKCNIVGVTLEIDNVAQRCWKVVAVSETDGFQFECWFYINNDDPVVRIEFQVIWTDRRDPERTKHIDGMYIEHGEILEFDWATRYSLPPSFRVGDKWVTILSGPRSMGDGEAYPFCAQMLCLPQHNLDEIDEGDDKNLLLAAKSGQIRAVSRDWQSNWFAMGHTPASPTQDPTADWVYADRRWQAFQMLLGMQGGITDQRPLGPLKYTRSTGEQEDHGPIKGHAAVTIGDPRWILEAEYSVFADLMRPVHHRETGGTRLEWVNHQDWITWDCYTHDQVLHTPSALLGKRRWAPLNGSGWYGQDDQHRSMNNLCAVYALTGSQMLRSHLLDNIETDLAMHKNRVGAPRAVGRLCTAWSHQYMVLDGDAKVKVNQIIEEKVASVKTGWAGGGVAGDIKVIAYNPGDNRLGIFDENGKPLPGWVPWELSLGMGLWAAYKATNNPAAADLAALNAKTCVGWSAFKQGDQWQNCKSVHYQLGINEGVSLDPSAYSADSKQVAVYNGFWTWMMAAYMVYRSSGMHVDQQLIDRANEIVSAHVPLGPTSWKQAEWLAYENWDANTVATVLEDHAPMFEEFIEDELATMIPS